MSPLMNDLINREGEIDLWHINVSDFIEHEKMWYEFLTQKEKERAKAFVFPHLTTRYSITHGILRKLLADYLSKAPEEVVFGYDQHGKPHLIENTHNLHFNLSDSDEISLIGISLGDEVGVDVERMKPDILEKNLQESVFSEREQATFKRKSNQVEAFYCAWTHKEARMKLSGMGLYQEPKSLEVPLSPLSEVEEMDQDYLRSFYLTDEYFAAIATKKANFRINLMKYRHG